MFTITLKKLAENQCVRQKLGMRLCENLFEKIIASFWKISLESTVIYADLLTVTAGSTYVVMRCSLKNEPGSVVIQWVMTLASSVMVLKYTSPIIKLAMIYRIYKAWKNNKLTISTSPFPHILFVLYFLRIM